MNDAEAVLALQAILLDSQDITQHRIDDLGSHLASRWINPVRLYEATTCRVLSMDQELMLEKLSPCYRAVLHPRYASRYHARRSPPKSHQGDGTRQFSPRTHTRSPVSGSRRNAGAVSDFAEQSARKAPRAQDRDVLIGMSDEEDEYEGKCREPRG